MEDFTRFFMGEALENLTVNGWKWLWGMSPSHFSEAAKTSDDIILEEITRSLVEVRSIIVKIQGAVEGVRLVTQEIEAQYHLKGEYQKELIEISLESDRKGDILAARSAMSQAIQLERFRSELKKRLEISQDRLITIQEIYIQKSDDLSLLEIDIKMIRTQGEVNTSISLDQSPDLMVFKEKFENVRTEIEDRYHQIQIEIQLSHSSNYELGKTLNTDDIDERIKELRNIENHPKNSGN